MSSTSLTMTFKKSSNNDDKEYIKFKENIKKLPDNIITKIMSFSSIIYRNQKIKITTQITTRIKNITIVNEILSSIWNYKCNIGELDSNFIEFCSTYLSYLTLKRLIKQCNRCFCCTAHCHHKPRSFRITDFNSNIEKLTPGIFYEKECKCSCRSLSRRYWRAYYKKLENDNLL